METQPSPKLQLEEGKSTIKSRFYGLSGARDTVLNRARKSSALTIPAVVPPDGHNEVNNLPTPYQSVGARGVNNMASKLLLSMFPPNVPFSRLRPDERFKNALKRAGDKAVDEMDKALSSVEVAIREELETYGLRPVMYEAFRNLLIAGNVLLYLTPDGTIKMFRLNDFAVLRDASGNVLEIIVREWVAPETLDPSLLGRINLTSENARHDKNLEIFTHVVRKGTHWEVRQEVEGETVPRSKGRYPLDASPWIPLRMTSVSGEDYGRGRVEEFYGDLRSLELLSKAIVQGSAAAAKVLFLVRPNGTTNAKVLTEAESGAVRSGDADDVSVLQLDKYADFRVAREMMQELTTRLSWAFLLNSAVQRDAERVTAEEIRLMASELEDTLGGLYSLLAAELQLPIVKRLMHVMKRQGKLPPIPDNTVKPVIITGIDAIGRGHDLQKLDAFIAGVAEIFGPQEIAKRVDAGTYMLRRANALGLDTDGLVKSDDILALEAQNEQLMAILQQVAPNVVNALSQQMTNGNISPDALSGLMPGQPDG